MLDTPSTTRLPTFDPQGHRMGPVGTLACQAAIVLGVLWSFGVIASFFLPPTLGLLPLLLAMGALVLAPKTVVMQLPVSLSVLGIVTVCISSLAWTIDPVATSVVLRNWMPSVLALVLAAGMLPLRDVAAALVWAVRIAVVITVIALVISPAARIHLDPDPDVPPYPGWHGFFLHKNRMTPFLVSAIATVVVFDRSFLIKWGTVGVIGVLMVGSTSATGISAAFLIVVALVWLRIYQSSRREDLRTSTLFFSASVLGFLGMAAGIVASLATITSAYGKELTFSGRTYIWAASLDAIGRRPFFGHGVGALFWQNDVSPETAQIWRQVGFEASHAHNGALDLALQVGVVGLAIYAVLWVSVFRRGWSVLNERPDLSVWVVSILFAHAFMSLSEDVYLAGWLALLSFMKVLLARRSDSLYAPPLNQMSRWS